MLETVHSTTYNGYCEKCFKLLFIPNWPSCNW